MLNIPVKNPGDRFTNTEFNSIVEEVNQKQDTINLDLTKVRVSVVANNQTEVNNFLQGPQNLEIDLYTNGVKTNTYWYNGIAGQKEERFNQQINLNNAPISTAQQAALDQKASKTELSDGLSTKANSSDVNSALASKVSNNDFNDGLSTKQSISQKNQVNGYAGLGSDGKLDNSLIKGYVLSSDVTNALRSSNSIYGILDQYTGEEFSCNKATLKTGGLQLTDLDVDNVIYFKIGSDFYKRNTFNNSYSLGWFNISNDAGLALQKAINSIGSNGGEISFPKRNDYLWGTVPKLPPELTNTLRIDGQGSKVTFTSTGKRFLDLNKTSNNQNFNNYLIENFEIDANNQANALSSDHVLIGSRVNNAFIGRFNADSWLLRNIKIYNIPEYSSGLRAGVLTISPFHTNPDESVQNKVTNIRLENVVATGGTGGFQINGFCGGSTSSANIYFDNIEVIRCRHYITTLPPVFYACSNLHIGGFGYGKRVVVEDFVGTNSGDNAIEINALMDVKIDGANMEGSQNYLLYFNNFRQPEDIKNQSFNVSNIYCNLTYQGSRAFSFGSEGSANIRLGHIRIKNMLVKNPNGLRSVNATALNLNPNGAGTKECESITVENLSYTSFGSPEVSVNSFPSIINTKLINNSKIFLKNVNINLSGTPTILNSSQFFPRIVEVLAGNYSLDIDGLNIVSDSNYSTLWGVYAEGTRTGITQISNYRVNSINSLFTSFRVQGTPFSSTSKLSVIDSDISNTSSGTDIFTSDSNQLNFIEFKGVGRRTGTTLTSVGDVLGVGVKFPNGGTAFEVFSTTRGILIPRLTTSERGFVTPLTTSLLIFNKSTNQYEYYDGTTWQGLSITSKDETYTVNTATSAPTKSSLNSSYGTYKEGSVVFYPNITGGGMKYTKLSSGNTSDWDQTSLTLVS